MMYPMIDKKKTAKRIKRMMKLSGKTPSDIQEYLGLSCIQTVYRWLEGINIPTIDNLYALSQMFRVPIDAMVDGNRKCFALRDFPQFIPNHAKPALPCQEGELIGERMKLFIWQYRHILNYYDYFVKIRKYGNPL